VNATDAIKTVIVVLLGLAVAVASLVAQSWVNERMVERVFARAQGELPPPKCGPIYENVGAQMIFKNEPLICIRVGDPTDELWGWVLLGR
jgi:hypothetical protein